MSHQHASDEMARQPRTAWFTYLDTIEPVRPAPYRYCRRLTRDMWDAEDLLQETTRKSGDRNRCLGWNRSRNRRAVGAHDGVSVVINYAHSGKESKSATPYVQSTRSSYRHRHEPVTVRTNLGGEKPGNRQPYCERSFMLREECARPGQGRFCSGLPASVCWPRRSECICSHPCSSSLQ